ncbi:hypothetical protein FEK35_01855 [Nocardia cyriacigeorgica]|uniref:Uncharacterized protein n=1 Tax=Nocardia cyriacigeorgica TaxID=135487 RepID=A0A5R8PLR3_9NOCA|nr:DUF6247 family protein [Nocardia cyriacigeorgica]TLG17898.1 hypothetical protein FEK35_01855 [Nocardia cyriacigeorgica]
MASPAPAPDPAGPPLTADPVAIRAVLTPTLRAIFDSEWELVLEQAKENKELTGIRAMLDKWRHIAHDELVEPGSYFRLQAKAEQIQRTGVNPDAATIEEMRAVIRQKLGQ